MFYSTKKHGTVDSVSLLKPWVPKQEWCVMLTWPPAGMVMERISPWGLAPPGLRSSRTALWLSA